MSLDTLGVAILGSGYMGRTYAECLAKYAKRCKFVAVWGGTRAPKLASDYGVQHAETYEAVLNRADVDALVITTPPGNHREHVLKAAARKKHVLVEKPMGASFRECDDMIAACRKANVYLEVLQTQRFRGAFVRAKKVIDEARLGKIRMVRGTSHYTNYEAQGAWAALPENGGPMLDLCVHCFDMMRYLVGSEAKEVFSTITSYTGHPFRDLTSMTQVLYANGAVGHEWACMEMTAPGLPNSMFHFVVVGEKAMLDIDGYGKIKIGEGNEWQTLWEMPPIEYINNPMDPIRLQSFTGALQAFIDDVLDHRPPTVSGEAGRDAVETVDAAKLSSRTGQSVKLPLPR